ncbi:hypothetical protein Nepgr_018601 [Nepenthes gracilis]|uniref:Uncharacterized protein n=1 Tax=Nepenthes gracilis TaxID=150966 RepID=A0AAD3SRS6_NEPGR|nr:hypothetical protein Nepgr_018601 [Nepenthes gracilis]
MDENKASDLHLYMPKDAPAASSHDAVESSHENEPVGTGAAAAPHGFCFRLSSYIVCPIVILIILVALLIWCPYALLAKLMGSKDVLSPKTRAGETIPRFELGNGCHCSVEMALPAAVAPVAVIVVSVPGLKPITVLGLPLWKWTVTVALVACGYHAISLLSQLTVKKLSRKMIKDKYDVVYYADGLRRSINNVIVCVFILLAWELYFRSSRHGLHRYGFSKKALNIGTWTAVSLLVDAFLVLAKNAVILSWESRAIYRQFTDNISNAGPQLYFLGLVSGSKFDIFSPREEGEDEGGGEAMNKPGAEENNGKQEDVNEKENKVKAAGEFSGKEDDKKENEEEEETTIKEQEKKINENEEEKKIIENKQGKKEKMDKEELEKEKRIKKEQEKKEKREKQEQDKEKKKVEKEQEQEKKKTEEANRFMSMNSKLSYASTYHKKQMAKYFILAARLSPRKDDTVPEEIRKQWERFKQQDDSEYITRNRVMEIVGKDNVESVEKKINILFEELKSADQLKDNDFKDQNLSSKDRIRYSTFEEWMHSSRSWSSYAGFFSRAFPLRRFFEKNNGKFKEGSMVTKDIGETTKIAIYFEHVMSVQDDTHAQCFKKKKKQRSELLKAILQQIQTKNSSSENNKAENLE